MTLSIITVNLNNRDGLQRTIDSVVGQTFTDYEWIVIDGGSTDGSRELIEQYADHFAYWCSEPDKGIYNAMNKGIAHAKGEWLQFLNSGDWLYEDTTLEKVFSKEYEADILYGNIIQTDKNVRQSITFDSDLTLSILYYQSLPHQSSFLRRKLFINKEYNENLKIVADWAFFLECALKKKRFIHIDFYVSYYDSTGISSTNRELVLKERDSVIKKIVPECIQRDMENQEKMRIKFADGQLEEIDAIRNKSRFFHRLVTLYIYILRFLTKFSFNKKKIYG